MARATIPASVRSQNVPRKSSPSVRDRKSSNHFKSQRFQPSTSSSGSDEGEITARSSQPLHAPESVEDEVEDDGSDAWTPRGPNIQEASPKCASLTTGDNVKPSGAVKNQTAAHRTSSPTADDRKHYGERGIARTIAKRTTGEDYSGSEFDDEKSGQSKPHDDRSDDAQHIQYGLSRSSRRNLAARRNGVPQQYSRELPRHASFPSPPKSQARVTMHPSRNDNHAMSDEIPETDHLDNDELHNGVLNSHANKDSETDSDGSRFEAPPESEEDALSNPQKKASISASRKRKRTNSPVADLLPKTKKPKASRARVSPEINSMNRTRDIGQFRDDEIETLQKFKQTFCEEYEVSGSQFNDCINMTKGTSWPSDLGFTRKVLFREFFRALPLRDNKSMLRFKDRRWRNRLEKSGSWTAEQDDELLEFVNTSGKKWAAIAQFLGRSYDEVHQRWKNKLQNRDTMRQGDWMREEVDALRVAVDEALEKLGPDRSAEDVSWEGISRALAYSRSAQQCSNKWRKVIAEDAKYRWLEEASLRVPDGYQVQLVRSRTTPDDSASSTLSNSLNKKSTSAKESISAKRLSTPASSCPRTPSPDKISKKQPSHVPESVAAIKETESQSKICAESNWSAVEGKLLEQKMVPPSASSLTQSKGKTLPLSEAFAATSPLMRPTQSQRNERPSPQIQIRRAPERTTEEDELSRGSGNARLGERISSPDTTSDDTSTDATSTSSEDTGDSEDSEASEEDGGSVSSARQHVSESETDGTSNDDDKSRGWYESMEIDAQSATEGSSTDSEAQVRIVGSPKSRLRERERASRSSSRRK